MPDDHACLERCLLEIIQHGRDRCASGWGKYPLGVLHAAQALLPLCDTPGVRERLTEFEQRLQQEP